MKRIGLILMVILLMSSQTVIIPDNESLNAQIKVSEDANFEPLIVDEFQVTSSSAYETTPTLGNDGTTDLVVFTIKTHDASGSGDIWYQRLVDGAPFGTPVQVTSAATNDELNDVWGDHIVYTAYNDLNSENGTIMVYKISTATLQAISSAEIMQEPRIHNNYVVWREGGQFAAKAMLYDLDWLETELNPVSIAGPDPPTFNIQIGDRFVVWSEIFIGHEVQFDVVVRNLDDATTFSVTNTLLVDESNPSTDGPWVVWSAHTHGSTSSRIIAMNVDTWQTRVIADNGAKNLKPIISGDLIVWESDLNGNMDVFVHQLSTSETFQVTNQPDDQLLSDVFGDLIVYADNRNGAADIYASRLSFTVYIPDSTFEQALIRLEIDSDETINQQILRRDAERVQELEIRSEDISDLTGIEAFLSLSTLKCNNNQLTQLDVSNNRLLEVLGCSANQLTELNTSNNRRLKYLNCWHNRITQLDLSANSRLEHLVCTYNDLSSLDVTNNLNLKRLACDWNYQISDLNVSNNLALTNLNCEANSINDLDVSNNIELIKLNCSRNPLGDLDVYTNRKLEELYCYRNQLNGLDISNNQELIHLECFSNHISELNVYENPRLEWLTCSDNRITSLNLSNNLKLNWLVCSDNQLIKLDLSTNINLNYLHLNQMPTLFEVCVWEIPFPPEGLRINTSGSPNVYFTTECSK